MEDPNAAGVTLPAIDTEKPCTLTRPIGLDLAITTRPRACIVTHGAPDRTMSVSPRPAELDALLEAAGGPDHVDVVLEPTGLAWVPVGVYAARRHLFLAAETARRRDPQLAEFYDRLSDRGKHHTCAVVAVAAKLLRRLYAVCKRVADDGGGYEIRDVDGTVLTRGQANAVVRERHPSKAAKARARREARVRKRAERCAAGNTRQPEGSSNGLATTLPDRRLPERRPMK